MYEIIDKKKAYFEKKDTTQHSVVLSDLSPLSADTRTLTNTNQKLHKLYLENMFLTRWGFQVCIHVNRLSKSMD